MTPYFVVFLLFLSSLSSAEILGPFPNGIPGSGYGCSNQCNAAGSVHYTLEVKLDTYTIPGSKNSTLSQNGNDLKMFTRTFVGITDESSPFCMNGYNGSTGPLGPCLQVNPGQRMTTKIINNIQNGMEALQQSKVPLEEFYGLASLPFGWLGPLPQTPNDFTIKTTENLPGWDASYDVINFHLHGMQVQPHLFYPMGTDNMYADWIEITPADQNPDQQCFCYVFDVSSDHPQGTFIWHTHRHGALTMQSWQALMGYVLVGTETFPGSPTSILANQGVFRTEPFALWDWSVNTNGSITGVPDTYIESSFFGPGFVEYLTNNEYQPTFDACVDETIYFQVLNGQTESASVLYVLDENNTVITFWQFASDGIMYTRAYNKTMVVSGQGQREALLMQFNKVGTYRIMQHVLPNPDQPGAQATIHPAAFVVVSNHACLGDGTDLSTLQFIAGMGSDIPNEDITQSINVNFQTNLQRDQAPLPQFEIDNLLTDSQRIDKLLPSEGAQQWTLSSTANEYHPFHIHVTPYQVVSINTGSEALDIELPGGNLKELLATVEPPLMWRDSVLIPPFGNVVVNQRFASSTGIGWAGKTIFHCHNMAHEDMGMETTFIIYNPTSPYAGSTCSSLNTTCMTDTDCCGFAEKSPVHCKKVSSSNSSLCSTCAVKGQKCKKSSQCCNKKASCKKRKCSK